MICLNMIVRNEVEVIERCLRSAIPFIDCWAIADTGSHDGTQTRISQILAALPGSLVEHPWRNFAYNRNQALAVARTVLPQEGEHLILFLDADEELLLPEGFSMPTPRPEPAPPGYYIRCDYGNLEYTRVALVNASLPWYWVGVVHEYLECDQPYHFWALDGPVIKVYHEGARARDPWTYYKDSWLLETALRADPTNTRTMFYLAQSYRDSGQLEKAIAMYTRRAESGGWAEEVWYSKFQIAMLSDIGGLVDPGELVRLYTYAYNYRPSRAEPLIEIAKLCRKHGDEIDAAYYDYMAACIPPTKDILFVNPKAYSKWQK